MLSTHSQSMLAPGIGDRILDVMNLDPLGPYFIVENKDSSLGATIEYVESDDGSTWATIAGTSTTIPPGQSNPQIVNSTKRHIALFAQGNVLLDVHVARFRNGIVSILN